MIIQYFNSIYVINFIDIDLIYFIIHHNFNLNENLLISYLINSFWNYCLLIMDLDKDCMLQVIQKVRMYVIFLCLYSYSYDIRYILYKIYIYIDIIFME